MDHVKVIFSRSPNIGSLFLRTFMWSAWSHSAVIDGDEVIEATMTKGVTVRTLSDFKNHASKWEIIEIPTEDPAAVIKAMRSQVGKRYDYFGVLGIYVGFHRRWQEDDCWFCSEIIAWAFSEAGTPLFRTDTWRILPRDIYIRTY